jgi:predicted nucleotidyltransferase
MIKKYPISSQISERLPSVETYLSRRKVVVFAYLLGSFVTGKVHPLSCLDVAGHNHCGPTVSGVG